MPRPDFHKVVEIARGDRQGLHSLRAVVPDVESLFEDAPVELQPGKMELEEQL